jgi:hypothetical protein
MISYEIDCGQALPENMDLMNSCNVILYAACHPDQRGGIFAGLRKSV